MSRLTFTKEEKERQELGPLKYMNDKTCAEWEAKLQQYEDLGEPEQLKKVVYCKDCIHFTLDQDGIRGKCDEFTCYFEEDDFCSCAKTWGRKPASQMLNVNPICEDSA